jgi:hypothetical protein
LPRFHSIISDRLTLPIFSYIRPFFRTPQKRVSDRNGKQPRVVFRISLRLNRQTIMNGFFTLLFLLSFTKAQTRAFTPSNISDNLACSLPIVEPACRTVDDRKSGRCKGGETITYQNRNKFAVQIQIKGFFN